MFRLSSSLFILSWSLETDGRAVVEGAAAMPKLPRVLSVAICGQFVALLGTGTSDKISWRCYIVSHRMEDTPLDFHSSCNNKVHTVTVIKCTKSCIFGGFASTSWNSHSRITKSGKLSSFRTTLINRST